MQLYGAIFWTSNISLGVELLRPMRQIETRALIYEDVRRMMNVNVGALY